MSTGRLNVFQRLSRAWDAVHPYNAGQACRVAGTFAPELLDHAWDDTLRTFSLNAGGPQRVRLVEHDLSLHFTSELNRRFDDAVEPPFRAFVQAAGESTWLVVVYQHWVADSVSVRLILREWLSRLFGLPLATAASRPAGETLRACPAVLPLLRRYLEYRRTRKVQTMGPLDYPTRVRLIDARVPTVSALLAYSRSRGVTLNDVLVAALAEVCGQLVPTEVRPGRRDLAISTVVDLRPTALRESGFGCLLGFNSTVCRRHELANWDRLLRSVTRRRGRRESAGVLWMLAAEMASRFTPQERMYDFYRKEAPFAGGISNVNLNGTWFSRQHPGRVLDYVRISPTGPLAPVAMNATTLGNDLRLSMTYRTALLNDWTAAELAGMFVERLTRISCGNV